MHPLTSVYRESKKVESKEEYFSVWNGFVWSTQTCAGHRDPFSMRETTWFLVLASREAPIHKKEHEQWSNFSFRNNPLKGIICKLGPTQNEPNNYAFWLSDATFNHGNQLVRLSYYFQCSPNWNDVQPVCCFCHALMQCWAIGSLLHYWFWNSLAVRNDDM